MNILNSLKCVGLAVMYTAKVASDTKLSTAKVVVSTVVDTIDSVVLATKIASSVVLKDEDTDQTVNMIIDHVDNRFVSTKYKVKVLSHTVDNVKDKADVSPAVKVKSTKARDKALVEFRKEYDAYVARRARNRFARFLVDGCLHRCVSYYPKAWIQATRKQELADHANKVVVVDNRSLSAWDMIKSCLVLSGSVGTVFVLVSTM